MTCVLVEAWAIMSTGLHTEAMWAMSLSCRREFTGASTAPMRQVANMAWMTSGWFGPSNITQSPGPTPSSVIPAAGAETRASSSRHVQRVSPCTTAAASGSRRAAVVRE